MESLYLLIPLSVLAVGVAVGVFFWMNNDGQFDDDQGPAWSILLDDDRAEENEKLPRDTDAGGSVVADVDGAGDARCETTDAPSKSKDGTA